MNLQSFQKNVDLASLTTFRIGGRAKYFFEGKTEGEIIEAVKLAEINKIPYFILGGGSNILVSDKGFDGLVIKIRNSKLKIRNSRIIVGAGMNLGKLINLLIENNLSGLEPLAGIPGTIGGAVHNNSGAWGVSIGDLVRKVKIKNKECKILELKNKDCKFGYKDSLFRKTKDVILEVELELKKGNKRKSQELIKEYLRRKKGTQPLEYPSAGCIFKNVEINEGLLKKFGPKIKKFSQNNKISAGWLIDQAGLKGYRIGQAQISEKHANFIINLGEAKAKEVVALISLIKEKIRSKFGIQLWEEIDYLGF